jgi:hypothetical protein
VRGVAPSVNYFISPGSACPLAEKNCGLENQDMMHYLRVIGCKFLLPVLAGFTKIEAKKPEKVDTKSKVIPQDVLEYVEHRRVSDARNALECRR